MEDDKDSIKYGPCLQGRYHLVQKQDLNIEKA